MPPKKDAQKPKASSAKIVEDKGSPHSYMYPRFVTNIDNRHLA